MNLLQKPTEPSKRVRYTIDDNCSSLKKMTLLSLYIKHSKVIPPIDGAISFVTCRIIGYQCFAAGFCHLSVMNFDFSPDMILKLLLCHYFPFHVLYPNPKSVYTLSSLLFCKQYTLIYIYICRGPSKLTIQYTNSFSYCK